MRFLEVLEVNYAQKRQLVRSYRATTFVDLFQQCIADHCWIQNLKSGELMFVSIYFPPAQNCPVGQIYINCSNPKVDAELSRERTCENKLLNLTFSAHLPCVSGCVCPPGWVIFLHCVLVHNYSWVTSVAITTEDVPYHCLENLSWLLPSKPSATFSMWLRTRKRTKFIWSTPLLWLALGLWKFSTASWGKLEEKNVSNGWP